MFSGFDKTSDVVFYFRTTKRFMFTNIATNLLLNVPFLKEDIYLSHMGELHSSYVVCWLCQLIYTEMRQNPSRCQNA